MIGLPKQIIAAMFLELTATPAISFWTIRRRYEYIYRPIVILTLLMLLLNTISGIISVCTFKEKGYARIISAILVNFAFGTIVFFINLRSARRIFVWDYAKFAILFNLPLIIHYLSIYILDQFDKIMVQKIVSIEAAAIYGVAYSAGMMMKIFTQSLHQTMVPWQYNKLKKQEFSDIDNNLFMLLLTMSGIMVCFSLCAPEIMLVLGGKKYVEARYLIAPVALGMIYSFAYSSFASIEFYYDINRFTMYISMGAAILNLILNFVGIKMYGYTAAAWTTAVCYLIMSISHYLYMNYSIKTRKKTDLGFNTKRLAILAAAIFGITIGIVLLYPYITIRYFCFVAIVIGIISNRKKIVSAYKQMRSIK